jgi:hypothetical protein
MIVKWIKDSDYDSDRGITAELPGVTLSVWYVGPGPRGGWRAWVNYTDLGTMPSRREAKAAALRKASRMYGKALRAVDDELARIESSR